jgi:dTDP-4-dehydrorhamnose reductase
MPAKRVLITGATGILGKALIDSCPGGIDLFATYLRDCWAGQLSCQTAKLDITDAKNTMELITNWSRPEVVIHAAGLSNVDQAENNQALARQINVDGTKNVIAACQQIKASLIYISTNAVFDGKNPPYTEEAERLPVNYYGQLKVAAEDLVINSGLKYSIIRAILMYGWHFSQGRPNPVTNWLRLLREGKTVKVVNDRFSQPLLATDCAKLIWKIINEDKNGIYHVSGADRMTLFDFACKTAEIFGLEQKLILPVPSSYFPEIAPRPEDTSFSTAKIKQALNYFPLGVIDGLKWMREAISVEGDNIYSV